MFGTAIELNAQTLEGTVIDGQSGEPIAMTYVALVTEDQRSVVAVTADTEGAFSLEAPSPGSYYVYASSIGYSPVVDGIFELGEGSLMEVEVRLEPDPVMMDSIRATVDRTERYLRTVGFYERMERDWGVFIDADEIGRRAVDRIAEVFRGIPRVQVFEPSSYDPRTGFYPEIRIRHGKDLCSPNLYVDGQLVHWGPGAMDLEGNTRNDPAMPDEFVTPSEVAAIEVYRSGTEVPPRYNTSRGCGVVLIWTHHGPS